MESSNSDSSFDISTELMKSFSQYSSSDLDDSKEMKEIAKKNQSENQNLIADGLSTIMEHKIKFNTSLASAKDVANILNNQPNALMQLPTCIATMKKNSDLRFDRQFLVYCDTNAMNYATVKIGVLIAINQPTKKNEFLGLYSPCTANQINIG